MSSPNTKSATKGRAKKPISNAAAIKSFVGYLEGSGKSLHTIKNYVSDLRAFEEFLKNGLSADHPAVLTTLTLEDVSKYHDYLKAKGFKTNTRRRKVMTVRKFLQYLKIRKKISVDISRKVPAPHKVERIPETLAIDEFYSRLRELETGSDILSRNILMLKTMAETGALVSEVPKIRFSDLSKNADGQAMITLRSREPREVPVSEELYREYEALKKSSGGDRAVFLGFNKFGTRGAAITPRGVEMLLKSYAPRLGYDALTPRLLRHSVVRFWIEQGISREEIQRRLGLKTQYAFRVFEPFFKSRT